MFLTGQEEIEAMSRTCRDIAKHLPDGCPSMLVLPLYASLPYAQQLRVFQGAPKVSHPTSAQPLPGTTLGAPAPVVRLQTRRVGQEVWGQFTGLERRRRGRQSCGGTGD